MRVDEHEEEVFLDVMKSGRLQSDVYNKIHSVRVEAGIKLISISDTSLDDVFNLW